VGAARRSRGPAAPLPQGSGASSGAGGGWRWDAGSQPRTQTHPWSWAQQRCDGEARATVYPAASPASGNNCNSLGNRRAGSGPGHIPQPSPCTQGVPLAHPGLLPLLVTTHLRAPMEGPSMPRVRRKKHQDTNELSRNRAELRRGVRGVSQGWRRPPRVLSAPWDGRCEPWGCGCRP